MFITFKLTLKKMFVFTAAIIIGVLCVDAVKNAMLPETVRCESVSDCAVYLKKQGVEVEAEPVYSNETVIDAEGKSGWQEYADRLKKQGFDITDYFGKKADIYCFRLKDRPHKAARMLLCEKRVIGYEVVDWF